VVREDADNLPPVLPAPIRARLESLDRAFVARIGGRTVAIAPVRDADRWDMIGAIVAVPVASEPPRFPPLPLALAGLAIALVAFAGRARAAWPGRIAALLVFLPAAAFAALLMRAGVPEPPALGPVAGAAAPVSAGSHAFWAAVLLAGWAVLADIGLSLARAAGAPLRFREALRAWTFLAPSFAHLLVFSIGPILFALWLSFHEWNLLLPARPFIGLDNYRELAGDGGFWRAVRNTALYVLFVPAGMVVALGLALLANRRMPGVNLLRTAFFLPYVTSFVAISLVWKWMFQPDVGLLNNALERIGIAAQPWLSSPATALPSLMLMSVWMYAGYMMVIFLAGLQSIPATLYESARIDGAGPWRRFRHITLPLLRPTLLFILVTMVIFMFQVFTAVYVMTEGGPLHSTDVVVYHIYRNAWEYLRMGYASAMAWVLFAIVFAVTLIQFRWLGGRPAQ
jgi:multiple sugar transport system permease protein